ncbi:MAG: nuclear transport factor 2 family protein, partial [Pseudomonadales bacterium]|nr:nuclear transport factor 2 family protein [Pseudomonadales bacterium]
MKRLPVLLIALLFFGAELKAANQSIDELLDGFHSAAANSNFDDYFSHFSSNGYFLGTDAAERWSVEKFKHYARPAFSAGRGWRYLVL